MAQNQDSLLEFLVFNFLGGPSLWQTNSLDLVLTKLQISEMSEALAGRENWGGKVYGTRERERERERERKGESRCRNSPIWFSSSLHLPALY